MVDQEDEPEVPLTPEQKAALAPIWARAFGFTMDDLRRRVSVTIKCTPTITEDAARTNEVIDRIVKGIKGEKP